RPADDEIAETGLLPNLAQRGILGPFARLEVALWESPIAIAVANEQIERPAVHHAKHDATGRGFIARSGSTGRRRPSGHSMRSAMSGSRFALPSMNWRTIGSVVCWISSTVPTCRTRPSYSMAMRVPTV